MSHRALATIDHAKPNEGGKPGAALRIHGGAVFEPGEVGLPPDEVRRLMDRGLLEESDLPLWDNPSVPLEGSSSIFGPLQSGGRPTPLLTPSYPQAPAEPKAVVDPEQPQHRGPQAGQRLGGGRDRRDTPT